MHYGGQYIGLGLNDYDKEIVKLKQHFKKKFGPARATLDESPLFDEAFKTEVNRVQGVYLREGKLKPEQVYLGLGVINLAMKYAVGYLKKEVFLPLYFSIEGHMSDMRFGPVAWVGDVLNAEGRALHFPTFYTNNTIPFKTRTGITELARRVGQTVQDNGVKFPAGTPWGLGGFSEGGLAISKFYLEYLAPGKPLAWRTPDLRFSLCAGSPYRPKGRVASWIPDPPAPDRQGISDVRLPDDMPFWWQEIARKGDLYTDNESSGDRALYKTMVYKIVAEGSFSGGAAGFLSRVMDLLSPTDDLIPVAMAIFDGMRFVADMSPHGAYNMDPAVQFARDRLAAPPVAA